MTDVLDIQDLAVAAPDGTAIARCERLAAGRGRVVGVVGPSGSGKTTLLRAAAGALPTGGTPSGTLRVLGRDVFSLGPGELRDFRRRHIGFVGQDPASRLNPRMRVQRSLTESAGRRDVDLDAVLAEVGLPTGGDLLRRRPGQLSGGQQRRVALARAFVREPDVLLLDEPTAGLDSSLRERLGELLRTRADEHGTTIVLACHDLSLVDKLADDVVDLTSGHERSPVARASRPAEAPEATGGPELLRVTGLHAWTGRSRKQAVLQDIDLGLPAGDALAVVGASGAGKTTLARAITGLHRPASGTISLSSEQLPLRAEKRPRAQRRRIQLVPQDPLGTLNPTRRVGAALDRPLRMHRGVAGSDMSTAVGKLLADVGLPAEFADRYPHELSGGQRQRVAVARALAADPEVLVCDEVTSSLDADTAEEIMALLTGLRRERELALVVISHEMPLVAQHTSTVLVLDEGCAVESGATADILNAPSHPATSALT